MASLLGGVFYFCIMPYTDHTNPDTAAEFGAVASQYDSAFNNPFDRAEEQFIFDYIQPHISNKYILDIGCGTGLVKRLTDRYLFRAMYTGVDYSKEMIDVANQMYPNKTALDNHKFVCADMVEYMDAVKPEYYDAVVAMYFPMNYCQHPPKRIYQAAKRILRPGGSLITVVATSRYAARKSHIVRAGNMRRYYHPTNDQFWEGDNLPKGMEITEKHGVNYFIEKYRAQLQYCPTAINKKLFELDQRRGMQAGVLPYIYILNITKA